jgi:hypothetical protein
MRRWAEWSPHAQKPSPGQAQPRSPQRQHPPRPVCQPLTRSTGEPMPTGRVRAAGTKPTTSQHPDQTGTPVTNSMASQAAPDPDSKRARHAGLSLCTIDHRDAGLVAQRQQRRRSPSRPPHALAVAPRVQPARQDRSVERRTPPCRSDKRPEATVPAHKPRRNSGRLTPRCCAGRWFAPDGWPRRRASPRGISRS